MIRARVLPLSADICRYLPLTRVPVCYVSHVACGWYGWELIGQVCRMRGASPPCAAHRALRGPPRGFAAVSSPRGRAKNVIVIVNTWFFFFCDNRGILDRPDRSPPGRRTPRSHTGALARWFGIIIIVLVKSGIISTRRVASVRGSLLGAQLSCAHSSHMQALFCHTHLHARRLSRQRGITCCTSGFAAIFPQRRACTASLVYVHVQHFALSFPRHARAIEAMIS